MTSFEGKVVRLGLEIKFSLPSNTTIDRNHRRSKRHGPRHSKTPRQPRRHPVPRRPQRRRLEVGCPLARGLLAHGHHRRRPLLHLRQCLDRNHHKRIWQTRRRSQYGRHYHPLHPYHIHE